MKTQKRDEKKYVIKCSDCKKKLGETNNMLDSVRGGLCQDCKKLWEPNKKGEKND